MHNIVISLISFMLSVTFFILTFFDIRNNEYVDSDTDKKCTDIHNTNLKNGDNCGAWDGTVCRKGLVTNGVCISKGTHLPLVLFILSSVFFLSFLIFMFLYLKERYF